MDCPTNTPLVRKLGIKAGSRVAMVEAPAGFPAVLAPLPKGVILQHSAVSGQDAELDVILVFVREKAELERQFPGLVPCLSPAGGLWVCWPKKRSGLATDLTEDVIRAIGLGEGLVDNKVCAVDAIWSGLRFVRRLVDRMKR
jgi:hypothetical protein